MLKINDAVKKLIFSSDLLNEALHLGIVNYSALARQLRPAVEAQTQKEVKSASIVVALSRLARQSTTSLRPKVVVSDLNLKTSLCDLSFDKTQTTLRLLNTMAEAIALVPNDFFTITQGVDEITVVAAQRYQAAIIQHMQAQPKTVLTDAVGIIVRFSPSYLDIPNTMYVLLAVLATQRINIVEIISTYTELTVVVNKSEAQSAFALWSQFLN